MRPNTINIRLQLLKPRRLPRRSKLLTRLVVDAVVQPASKFPRIRVGSVQIIRSLVEEAEREEIVRVEYARAGAPILVPLGDAVVILPVRITPGGRKVSSGGVAKEIMHDILDGLGNMVVEFPTAKSATVPKYSD
jgi:hypothetical protein